MSLCCILNFSSYFGKVHKFKLFDTSILYISEIDMLFVSDGSIGFIFLFLLKFFEIFCLMSLYTAYSRFFCSVRIGIFKVLDSVVLFVSITDLLFVGDCSIECILFEFSYSLSFGVVLLPSTCFSLIQNDHLFYLNNFLNGTHR